MLENLSVSVEIRILKALNFLAESYDLAALDFSVMTLQHWVSQLWPSRMEVSWINAHNQIYVSLDLKIVCFAILHSTTCLQVYKTCLRVLMENRCLTRLTRTCGLQLIGWRFRPFFQMSMVPLLFRDWWNDTESPSRLIDQHFGLGVNRDELMANFLRPHRHYVRPWALARQNSGSSCLSADKDRFQVYFPLNFKHWIFHLSLFNPSSPSRATAEQDERLT